MDPVAVTAVAQLAVELVNQVAAVGEDQDAAGAGAFDEAERGHRLARAGRMLEPEPSVGIGVLRSFLELDVLVQLPVVLPILGLLILALAVVEVLVLVLVAGDRRRGHQRGLRCRRGDGRWSRCAAASASSAVRVPESAST